VSALLGIGRVGEARLRARALLHEDLETALPQVGKELGHERDPPLQGGGLPGNPDPNDDA
jgi:hypothetical protein